MCPTCLAVSDAETGGNGRSVRVGVLDDFERSLIAAGQSELTWRRYLQTVRAYVAAVDPMIAEPRDVEAYLSSLGVRRSSLAQYHGRLKKFHAFLVREGYRPSNPVDQVGRPRIAPGVPRPLPDEWIGAIWRIAVPRERAWIALGLYCGLRAGEAVNVCVEDIDGRTLIVHGKGDKVRRVPLRDEVLDALDVVGWPRSGPFFPGSTRRWASGAIGELLRQVGAPPRYSFHSLRHRFGTEAYRASRDVKVVSELLGHASIQATMVYAAADPDHQQWVVAQMPTIVGTSTREGSREVVEEASRGERGRARGGRHELRFV